jgi:glycosyltransferase involved in cell wall biosynthesis
MRVLWASHFIPYPPKSGVHVRSYHLLRAVAAQHEVDLVAFIREAWLRIFFSSREEALRACAQELGRMCRSIRFLPIDNLVRRGGTWRTALEGLICPASYTLRYLQSRNAHQTFAEIAAGAKYAVAHFDTIGLAPFHEHFGDTPATLGHHNIESHLLLRRASNETNPLKRLYFLQEGLRVQKYEAQTAASFAAHITCSDLDGERLRSIAPQAHTVTIANGVDVDYFRAACGPAVNSTRLIFVGSLNWYPNVDAVLFLLRDIWPLTKKAIPALQLDIVGSAPPLRIIELAAQLQGVKVHGFVDDVRPLMDRAALYVCPIRDGGGTKLKILDAFAMQQCVIAHPIACEGIDVVAGRHVEFADSAEAFTASIGRLLQQPRERDEMGRAARQLVVERYSFAQIGQRLCEVFESVAARSTNAACSADH